MYVNIIFVYFCITLFCGIQILCSLLNTKLKHPQTKKIAYGHERCPLAQVVQLPSDTCSLAAA